MTVYFNVLTTGNTTFLLLHFGGISVMNEPKQTDVEQMCLYLFVT